MRAGAGDGGDMATIPHRAAGPLARDSGARAAPRTRRQRRARRRRWCPPDVDRAGPPGGGGGRRGRRPHLRRRHGRSRTDPGPAAGRALGGDRVHACRFRAPLGPGGGGDRRSALRWAGRRGPVARPRGPARRCGRPEGRSQARPRRRRRARHRARHVRAARRDGPGHQACPVGDAAGRSGRA